MDNESLEAIARPLARGIVMILRRAWTMFERFWDFIAHDHFWATLAVLAGVLTLLSAVS